MQFPEGKNWHTLNSLLDELLDLDAAARQQRLAALARERPDLLEPLTRLLEGSGKSDTLDAVLGETLRFLADRETLSEQRRLGPWKVLSELGRGGMAQVFLAERADGAFEQKAALKLLWPGMADANVLARFEQERQILAALDDSRIARLIDGGVTDDGRPWLVMEYVEGLPVDEYCDQHQLGIDRRLELFCQITAAVGAAHRRLVVHRDIKPANVLVTGDGRVKLLDFGIAKLLDEEAMPHAAPATRRAERLLTPEYASPEQLTESPITTASDVYQLGALLFQLLTGEPPHRRKGLSTAEFEAHVVSGESPRPSLRVRTLDGDVARAVARARGLTPKTLVRRLRGDLNAIVAQSMATDPEARYVSADALQEDVKRVLAAQPVAARTAGRAYYLRRYVRRHRGGVAAAALLLLGLVAYVGTITWQSMRLAAERDAAESARVQAETMRGFVLDLFGSMDPADSERLGKSAEDLLLEGLDRIEREFEHQPLLAAALLLDLGDVMHRRSMLEPAETAFRRSLDLRRGILGVDHPDTLVSLERLGQVLNHRGNPRGARELHQQVLRGRERHFGPDSEEFIETLILQARNESELGNEEQVMALLQQALATMEAREATTHRDYIEVLSDLGRSFFVQQKYEEAEPLFARSLALSEDHYGPAHPFTLTVRRNRAAVLRELGEYDHAWTEFQEVLAGEMEVFAPPHRKLAITHGHLARTATALERYEVAVEHWRHSVEIAEEALGADHPWLPSIRLQLAQSLLNAGHGDQARDMLQGLAALENEYPEEAAQAREVLARLETENRVPPAPAEG